MRLKEMEQKLLALFGIMVEVNDSYSGSVPGTFIGEIFFVSARAEKYPGEFYDKQRDLQKLVDIISKLNIHIDTKDSNPVASTGVMCRSTKGYRSTDQILFRDQVTFDKFKQEVDRLYLNAPQEQQSAEPFFNKYSVSSLAKPLESFPEEKKDQSQPNNFMPAINFSKMFGS